MRLLIYGSARNPNTIASFFTRNFDSSVQYQILRFPDIFAEHLASSFYRIVFRVFPGFLIRKMDKHFLAQTREYSPDVILIFKGMEISKRSLIQVRKEGIKLVNYNFDHPFHFFSRGTGNRFVKDAIRSYDLHISYSTRIAKELSVKYGVRTACIPFGFHLTMEQFQEVVRENRPEVRRACFVGNPDGLRVVNLKRLVAENIPIALYGFGWEQYFEESDLVEIHPPRKPGSFWADPVEFWKVLRQYRVQLNFFRPHNEGSHNLRTFEVPAVGGILLTPKSDEQDEFFEDGIEMFTYDDLESLLGQCKWLLEQDTASIERSRSRAREKSLANDYSYSRRTQDLLRLLQNLEKK